MILKTIKQRIIQYGDAAEHTVFKTPYYVHMSNDRDYSKSKEPAEKRDDSLTRTRTTIYRRIHANIRAHGKFPPIFLTLTYAENISSIRQGNNDFRAFIKRLSYHCNTRLKYVAIPEWQERGAIHYHIMFFNLPRIHYSKVAEIWGHGSIRIEAARNIKNLAAYMSKYLTKDIINERAKGQRLLLASKGLILSTTYDDEDIDIFRERYKIVSEGDRLETPKRKLTKFKITKYEDYARNNKSPNCTKNSQGLEDGRSHGSFKKVGTPHRQ